MNECNETEIMNIKLDDNLKELNLSSEEELIIKKYLYYADHVPDYEDLNKTTFSGALGYLIQLIFDVYTREYALHILSHISNDLSQVKINDVVATLSRISRLISYADEYKNEEE